MNKIKAFVLEYIIDQLILYFHPRVDVVSVNLKTRSISVMTYDNNVYNMYPGEQKLIESKH